jgi:pentatricopeptide repeat protein
MELVRPGANNGAGTVPAILPSSQEIVLRALVQAQQLTKAAELLRNLCNAGVTPPGDTVFNGVVDAAVRARAYAEAWDVLELLLLHRRRADKYFVSILTKSLESSNDRRWVRRGISLVDRFIEQQREDVDEIVFNSLLNVLGHVGDMLKLQQTLSKMVEYGVPPSAVTYGTVVKAYGRARDIDAVLKVWNEMRGRCLGVNPVTCGCVLDACVKCGHLDKAMAIFQEMRLQGLHKNTVLYATLIKGLAGARLGSRLPPLPGDANRRGSMQPRYLQLAHGCVRALR